jgi:holo-[acyl-carrier protein] synthase
MSGFPPDAAVLASAVEVMEVDEVERRLAQGELAPFAAGELAFAQARPDPARRLAARLAAKRAAVRVLGAPARAEQVEVVRGEYGPPRLVLRGDAARRLVELGASRTLVSLTHERRHAAALVLLLR